MRPMRYFVGPAVHDTSVYELHRAHTYAVTEINTCGRVQLKSSDHVDEDNHADI